jgi:DNA-binding MarR family transcriptional regulator
MSELAPPRAVGVFEWIAAFRDADKGKPLTPSVVAVAFVLASFATYKTGLDARPSGARIAACAGVHRATVTHALADLARVGWVEVTASPEGAPRVYRLTVPGVPALHGVPRLLPTGAPASRLGPPYLTPQNMGTTSAPTSTTSALYSGADEPASELRGEAAWDYVEAQEALRG